MFDVLRLQFGSQLPEELTAQIKTLANDAEISRWLEAAVKSHTLEQFQSRVNSRS